jgi:gliding motility-associated-like protein
MKSRLILLILGILTRQVLFATAPTITSFSPASGSVGTLVIINGSNLGTPTAFTIGGVAALVINNTGTVLTGFVMPGAATGAISLTTSGGTVTGGSNFTVTPTSHPSVQQGAKLVGMGNTGYADQGGSVSLSADGNTAMVGGVSDNNDQGAAWVYTRSGGIWSQQGGKLVGTGNTGGADQGSSVSLSADGNTAIVGGRFDNNAQGAAWVYTRSGGTWSQQGGKLVGTGNTGAAQQGVSVSLSADGNTAIVGGYLDNNYVGAVWVYTRSGGAWSQQGGKLVGTGNTGAARQGVSVSLSADGNTAIVGGGADNNSQGAAWVYARSGGVWSQQGGKIVGTGNTGAANQGLSVSLSADGNTAIVGGQSDNNFQGAAWVYTRSGDTWSQQGSKLVGTGNTGKAQQGVSVSLSADGNTAIVGGYYDNLNQGATWVYTRIGAAWSQQGSSLIGTGNTGAAWQGGSVSLSADGNTAMVGGTEDNSNQGAAWVYAVASTDPTLSALSALSISSGTLTPAFATGTTGYTDKVANTVDSIAFRATTTSSTATETINGITVPEGTISPYFRLNVGVNTITIIVTSHDGVTKDTYTIAVTRLSNIATLSKLTVSSGTLTPAFATGTTDYTDNVANTVTSIAVRAITTDPTATETINGIAVPEGTVSPYIQLYVGSTTILVQVTAQDGVTEGYYTITVTRLSNIATLSKLTVSSGTLTPAFATGTTSYTDVAHSVSSIAFRATTTNSLATETINGTAVPEGTVSPYIPLTAGMNTINVVVTAQDGVTKETYTVGVTRLPEVATLSKLTVSSGTLTPGFETTTTGYTDNVANTVSSIAFRAITTDPLATETINGTAVPEGTVSPYFPLNVGSNTIKVVITAQDGVTQDIYTITVTRLLANDATLAKLTVSSGALSPAFASATTSYTDNVANAVTSIAFRATTTAALATETINGTAVPEGTVSPYFPLNVGSNTITIIVTASDGVTKDTYTIMVTVVAPPMADAAYQPISVETMGNPQLSNDGILVHMGVSPNGDGIDDFFKIDNITNYPDNRLAIMNRNGMLVYEAKGYDNASKLFDGHSNKNGAMQLPGTYFYELDYTVNGITKHKTGFLVLKY